VDRITSSLLAEFSADVGLTTAPEDQRFEHFATYLSTSRFLSETFDTTDVVLGSGGDTGIDAIAIIVNGALVTDPEMVEELAETNGYIDATFIFVQADRSAGFETTKIGQIGFGVVDFFNKSPTLPRNDAVKAAAEIMSEIFNRSSKFKRGNPNCRVFYVTTGRWVGDANLDARRKAVVQDLDALNIFGETEFSCIGADVIQRLFHQTKNAISRDFTFAERVLIPEIDGVKEAYLGLLPIREFLTLLDDGDGEILKGIFYDNVRDWQEYNAVNAEIRSTLESSPQRARFVLMNNGVTIIAKTLRTTGNKFHIEDYQIVNGCQTSHVLFDNQKLLDDKIVVPLRLIATDDEEVTASIVKATNRQTEVKAEQLIALSDFQKQLEAYFQTFEPANRLFYERRSRQYNSQGVEKTRIVTPASLIRAYASSFLEEPHRTTRTYRALLAQLGTKIFVPGDRLEPYYYAASALYRIEFQFRNGQLDSKYKPARYHVLLAARLLVQPGDVPRTNSREMERFCQPLINSMWNTGQAEAILGDAAAIVNAAAAGNFHRDQIRTQPFTEKVKQMCLARTGRPDNKKKPSG
jgi:hypothetical protein